MILVRKTRHPGAKSRARNWVLQRLPIHKTTGRVTRQQQGTELDLEEFKEDLEEDIVMRQEVNLWKDPR